MNSEKKKRVFTAVLSGLIMFVTILVAVVSYQLVGIITRKNEIERLDAEIRELQLQIEQTEDEILSWQLEWKIIERALRLGMVFEDEEDA